MVVGSQTVVVFECSTVPVTLLLAGIHIKSGTVTIMVTNTVGPYA